MKKITSVLVSAALITSLSGCVATGQQNGISSETGGTVLGAVAGGLLGSQIGHGQGTTVAIIGGTLLGGFLGNRAGAYLDQRSQAAANQAAQQAMDSGQQQNWQTQSASGTVKPHKKYHKKGKTCRAFTTTVNMSGQAQPQTVQGTACKNSQGQWIIQK